MKISYQPHGICPRRIDLEVEDDIVQNVQFLGGCNGKGTSCPAQLAKALEENFT